MYYYLSKLSEMGAAISTIFQRWWNYYFRKVPVIPMEWLDYTSVAKQLITCMRRRGNLKLLELLEISPLLAGYVLLEVDNHLWDTYLNSLYNESRTFFAQDATTKQNHQHPDDNLGYVRNPTRFILICARYLFLAKENTSS